jgi:hypothetical protein
MDQTKNLAKKNKKLRSCIAEGAQRENDTLVIPLRYVRVLCASAVSEYRLKAGTATIE